MGNINPTLNCLKSNDKENIDNEQNKAIAEIKLDIKLIKENHLEHLKEDVREIKTDVKLILLRL